MWVCGGEAEAVHCDTVVLDMPIERALADHRYRKHRGVSHAFFGDLESRTTAEPLNDVCQARCCPYLEYPFAYDQPHRNAGCLV